MRTSLLLSALAGVLAASPALAQDMAPPVPQDTAATTEPGRPVANTLRGFRIEGNVCGDRYQSQGTHRDKLG